MAEREGCDLSPLAPAVDADCVALQSYVWPDEAQRLADLRAALLIAREHPVPIAFVGVGEGLDDLRPFAAKDYAEALLPDEAPAEGGR